MVVVLRMAVRALRREREDYDVSTPREPDDASPVATPVGNPPGPVAGARRQGGLTDEVPAPAGKHEVLRGVGGVPGVPIATAEDERYQLPGARPTTTDPSSGDLSSVATAGSAAIDAPVPLDKPYVVPDGPVVDSAPLRFQRRGLGNEEKGVFLECARDLQAQVAAFTFLSTLAVLMPPASSLVRRDV